MSWKQHASQNQWNVSVDEAAGPRFLGKQLIAYRAFKYCSRQNIKLLFITSNLIASLNDSFISMMTDRHQLWMNASTDLGIKSILSSIEFRFKQR